MDEADSENSGQRAQKTALFVERRRLEQGRFSNEGDLRKSAEDTKATTTSEDSSLKGVRQPCQHNPFSINMKTRSVSVNIKISPS